ILERGQAEAFEEVADTPEGRRTFLSIKAPRRDARGNIIGLIGISHDVTDQKRAELELFAATQKLQALMQALPVGVSFSDDATCQRITGNPAVLAQFEVTARDNLSASAPDFSAPGRQVRFFRKGQPITDAELPLQRAVAEGREIAPMELEVRLPSGRQWVAEASGAPIRNQDGRLIGGVAVTVDITARKQAEDALRRSEEQLRMQRQRNPIGCIVHDADLRFSQVNPAAEAIFGYSEAELRGLPVSVIVPVAARPHVEDILRRLAQGDMTAHSVNENLTKDGRTITCQWTNTPLRDAQGEFVGFLSMVQDVTESKRSEEALRLSEEKHRLIAENTADVISSRCVHQWYESAFYLCQPLHPAPPWIHR
ncbi:MAG TPA: PAS domain S-box protein, partial [Spirochaetia bacterium]|nr:PAS domain S-box protein [Spirochaetia bacterium]